MEDRFLDVPANRIEELLQLARFNEGSDEAQLRQMLQEEPSLVNAQDQEGRTAVHMASANGHLTIVEHLIELGAMPDLANAEGNTALHYAALDNQCLCAKALLQAKWTTSARNNFGLTPRQVIGNKPYEEMDLLLLEFDTQVDHYAVPEGSHLDLGHLDPTAAEGSAEGTGNAAPLASEKKKQEVVPTQPKPGPKALIPPLQGPNLGGDQLNDIE